MRLDELDTPTLFVDLDALEGNLDRFQSYFTSHGIGLRPHIKTHKTLAIAHMQMARGAIGLTCQKLGEAEVMAAGGLFQDILIPYNVMGSQKLDRLTALASWAKLTLGVDSAYTLRGLSEACSRDGVTVGVLIDVDFSGARTGVTSASEAVELGVLAHRLPGLELRGIMGFPTPPEIRPQLQAVLAAFDAAGLPHPTVSGGSTKSALSAHFLPELTEYRAGEYPVGGAGHLYEGRHTVEQCALRVISTVVSRPTPDRMYLDAGSKTLSASLATFRGGPCAGHIVEYPEARIHGFSEEHGHVDISACDRKPEIGERVQVLPVHPCPCVNEHDELVAVRKGRVQAVWPIHARGKIR